MQDPSDYREVKVEPDPDPAAPKAESQPRVSVEEFSIDGDALVAKVKELIHQGNVRRIIIKNAESHTLIEIPLTIGVVGGVVGATIFPLIAALGAIGALVARLKIVIEKQE